MITFNYVNMMAGFGADGVCRNSGNGSGDRELCVQKDGY